MPEPLIVNFRKPLYGTYCNLNETILRKAIREGRKIVMRLPQGDGLIDPQYWIDHGKKMSKVYNRPNEPMVTFGMSVEVGNMKQPSIEI